MLHEFSYHAPRSRRELFRLLADHGPDARLLAGGTDLLIDLRAGERVPAAVVDLKRVREYGTLLWSRRTGLLIGPRATCADLLAHRAVRKQFPLLILASEHLGSTQVRNRATVIGNICNASPCSDLAVALLCLDASVVIGSAAGQRAVRLAEFFAGVKRTTLAVGEVVEQVVVPAAMAGGKCGFEKLKRIKGHDLALVSVGLWRKGTRLRVAVGSAAPTPILLPEFKTTTPATAIIRTALRRVKPIDDIRCSQAYRLFMVRTYLQRLLDTVR